MFTYKVAQPFQVSHFCAVSLLGTFIARHRLEPENSSSTVAIHKSRILKKSLLKKTFFTFKNGIKMCKPRVKSLLILALLKLFPYTVPWKEVYLVIFEFKCSFMPYEETSIQKYANSISVCQALKEHTKTCLGSWKRTFRRQINESTRLAFLDFFPTLLALFSPYSFIRHFLRILNYFIINFPKKQ